MLTQDVLPHAHTDALTSLADTEYTMGLIRWGERWTCVICIKTVDVGVVTWYM